MKLFGDKRHLVAAHFWSKILLQPLNQLSEGVDVFKTEVNRGKTNVGDLIKRMRPDRFDDLVALVALFRPGPLQSGMVDDFIKRKHGLIPIEYEIPELENILRETYGEKEADTWWVRWRLFFMACAELFGYAGGNEWWVSHYLFERPEA